MAVTATAILNDIHLSSSVAAASAPVRFRSNPSSGIVDRGN
jgi:hypothetical protein